jgi:hypothetical protein
MTGLSRVEWTSNCRSSHQKRLEGSSAHYSSVSKWWATPLARAGVGALCCACAALVLCIAPLLAHAQSPNAGASENARGKLDRPAEFLIGQNYRQFAPKVIDRISAGQVKNFPVQLVAGVSNAVIAACGQNCDQVQISLYDFRHTLLTRSSEKADVVVKTGRAQYDGLYEVEVAVPGCHAAECEVGLMVLRQETAATTKQSDNNAPIGDSSLIGEIQSRLYELNFDPGPLDGNSNDSMKQAIREFEAKNNMAQTGEPTQEILRRLRQADALKPWGTIVYMKGGEKWGMSWGHETRRAAVASALSSCGGQCSSELSFSGTECAAFAYSGKSWAIVARNDVQRARDAAIAECETKGGNCRIIAAVCADGSERISAGK